MQLQQSGETDNPAVEYVNGFEAAQENALYRIILGEIKNTYDEVVISGEYDLKVLAYVRFRRKVEDGGGIVAAG